jgi:hypothetical protein
MVAFDICGFSSSGDPHLMSHMCRSMYQVIKDAAETAQMPWADCEHENRGDGCFVLAPPGTSVHSLVYPLAPLIRDGLSKVNKTLPADHPLRLRMAVHHGDVVHDEHGVISPDLNLLFHMLNAPVLRARFEHGDLALIVSDDVYRRVVKWRPGLIDSKDFEPLMVDSKVSACPAREAACAGRSGFRVAWAALPPQPVSPPPSQVAALDGPTALAQIERILEMVENLLPGEEAD